MTIQHDDSIDVILADFLQKQERGESVDATALLEKHPQHASEIREFLGDLAHMQGVASSGVAEPPGTKIGPYKLREVIGKGGFGVVYRAEQLKPVRRHVALKIVKPGMDTGEVMARFEAERQALALMDHPNISRVLDAGATDAGRPYFVMELIKGIPITDYCDQCNLDITDRLKLFRSVCRAIQHAHQKGIIHRDIKPTNVLVAIQEGQPEPKVIDFGVAKAINQRLTEHSLMTGFAQMIGTPLYMSPEQAEMSPLDVDTRSDIYSLGVLLYELLTGTTPLSKERLKTVTYDEIRRLIREEEPQIPSARLSTLGACTTVAECRRSQPHKLAQLYRGDLDWIVLKALEKDRTRRYEAVSSFAEDVTRFLTYQPVQASPPSKAYRLRKFVRRNKAALATGLAITVLLIAGTVTATILAIRATSAEDLAEWRLSEFQKARRESDAASAREAARIAEINRSLQDVLVDLQDIRQRNASATEQVELSDELRRLMGQAETLAEADGADARLVDHVLHLRDELLSAEKDRQALALLQHARRMVYSDTGQLDPTRPSVWMRIQGAGVQLVHEQAYMNVLALFDIDPDDTDAKTAAKLLKSRPRTIQTAVIAGLDEWFEQQHTPPKRKEWILAVLDAASDDPWRMRLRRAIRDKDREALMQLAKSEELAKQQPYTVLMLVNAHMRLGIEGALELLVREQLRHMSDFRINSYLATHMYSRSQYEDALRYASMASALRPDGRYVLHNVGVIYENLGRRDEAARTYLRDLPRSHNTENILRLGRLWEADDNWEAATALYEDAYDVLPDNREISQQYAEGLVQVGRLTESESIWKSAVVNCEREFLIALQTSASAQYRQQHYEILRQAYGKLLHCLAKTENDQTLVAELAAEVDDVDMTRLPQAPQYQLMLECAKRAAKLAPNNASAQYHLGIALSYFDRDEAIDVFRRLSQPAWPAKIRADSAMLWAMTEEDPLVAERVLLDALKRLNDGPPIEPELRKRLQSNIYFRLAAIVDALSKNSQRPPEDAIRWLRRATQLVPDSVQNWLSLARLHQALGNWQQADEAARRVLALQTRPDAVWIVTEAQSKMGDLDQARRYYDVALKTGIGNISRTRVELNELLQGEPRVDVAVDQLLKLYDLHNGRPRYTLVHRRQDLRNIIDLLKKSEQEPGEEEYLANCRNLRVAVEELLSRLIGSQETNETALRVLERVVAAQPENGMALAMLSRRYLINRRYEDAASILRRQVKLNPDVPPGRTHIQLSLALAKLAQHEEAAANLVEVIRNAKYQHIRVTVMNALTGILLENTGNAVALSAYEDALSQVLQEEPTRDILVNATVAFAKAGLWDTAVTIDRQLLAQFPDNSWSWLHHAPILIFGGEAEEYREHCRKMIAKFGAGEDYEAASRICKVCCLLPDAVELEKLPIAPLADSLDTGTTADYFPPWGWCTRALVSVRKGDAESALTFLDKARQAKPPVQARALALAIEVLARLDLQQLDVARKKLTAADQAVKNLPADQVYSYLDILMPTILLREAEQRLEFRSEISNNAGPVN